MRALVVYESTYGNTQQLATAIRDGLAETMAVDLRSVDDNTPFVLADYQLVVVGGPTHAYGMSTPESRAHARGRQPVEGASSAGVRDWLPWIDSGYAGVVAVFDSRCGRHRRWPGSASRSMGRYLRKAGIRVFDRHSFLVAAVTGPLRDGELYQARLWGTGLGVGVRLRNGRHRGIPDGRRP